MMRPAYHYLKKQAGIDMGVIGRKIFRPYMDKFQGIILSKDTKLWRSPQ